MPAIEIRTNGLHGSIIVDGVTWHPVCAVDVALRVGDIPRVDVTLQGVPAMLCAFESARARARIDDTHIDEFIPEYFQRALLAHLRAKFPDDDAPPTTDDKENKT